MGTSCERSVRGQVWMLNFQCSTMKQTTENVQICCCRVHFSLGCIFFNILPCFNSICVCIYKTLYLCECTFFPLRIIGHHIPCQRKYAVYYLVYLDIWLLLFGSAPTQIMLIALTNTASPVC